jgi:hypothetical protein
MAGIVLLDYHILIAIQPAADFISDGAIAKECGFTRDSIERELTKWQEAGQTVCRSLDLDADDLGEVQRQRVYQYYLPVYFWCLSQLEQHKAAGQKQPLVVRTLWHPDMIQPAHVCHAQAIHLLHLQRPCVCNPSDLTWCFAAHMLLLGRAAAVSAVQ